MQKQDDKARSQRTDLCLKPFFLRLSATQRTHNVKRHAHTPCHPTPQTLVANTRRTTHSKPARPLRIPPSEHAFLTDSLFDRQKDGWLFQIGRRRKCPSARA